MKYKIITISREFGSGGDILESRPPGAWGCVFLTVKSLYGLRRKADCPKILLKGGESMHRKKVYSPILLWGGILRAVPSRIIYIRSNVRLF